MTTTADTFPYRFVAADGMYEGTTFVYLASGAVISYKTDSPARYFRTPPTSGFAGMRPILQSTRHEMTPEALARFEAIPLREPADSRVSGRQENEQ